MTNLSESELLNRTKKGIGQMESVLRARDADEPRAEALQRLAAARGRHPWADG
jgi:DNA-binding FrmR family transcriptional regulator